MRSNITAPARMTTRNAAINLRKIPFLTSSSLWSLEAVARAAHGLKVARGLRVRFDFFPDAADGNGNRERGHVGSVAPNGIQQMIAGKDAAEVAREVVQQTEFGGRGGNDLSADSEDHGRR